MCKAKASIAHLFPIGIGMILLPIDGCVARDLQAEILALSKAGGGSYRLRPGETVVLPRGIILPEKVTLDLNGGELVAVLTEANAAGVRLLSDSALRNGTVTVRSGGSPASQSGAHAPVLVGALYGESLPAPQLSPFNSPAGWTISNVVLRSDKSAGAPAIQVMGDAHDGVIENVTVPDSDRMLGGVLLDWGTVGSIKSDDAPGNAVAFGRGQAYTTHPHAIVIRNIRIGRLTRPPVGESGSFGVRLSGVHDVSVMNVTIGTVTQAAILHTAGDLGYEFARPADRARAHRGIVVDGVRAERAGAYLVRSDSYADNIGRAKDRGYRPMLDPIGQTDIVVRNVFGRYLGQGGPGFGLRIDHQRGGHFYDITAEGFRRGFFIDEQVFDLALDRPSAGGSLEAAISVEHPYRSPARITVRGLRVSGDDRARAVIVGRSEDVAIVTPGNAIVRQSPLARRARVAPAP